MTDQEIKSLYLGIGRRIRNLRLQRGLSQEAFALLLNLTRASIVNIEKGRQRVTIHLIYDICRITGAKISDILLPEIQKDEDFLPLWLEKINSTPEGDIFREKQLTDFLLNINSKEPK